MARRKISQYDARRYKRELEELRNKTRQARSVWGAVFLRSITVGDMTKLALETAESLGHPLACSLVGSVLKIYGVR